MQMLFDWFWFVIGHLVRVIIDILTIILSPVIFILYARERGGLFGSKKKFKSILITGATSGIGKSLAIEFAKKGVTLVLTGRNETRLRQVASECTEKGSKVISQVIDVCDKKEMQSFISKTDKEVAFDLVVANAGIGVSSCSDKWYGTSCDEIIQTNINGVLNTILPGIYAMQTRSKTGKRGHIAITGSVASWVPYAGRSMYSSSKAAIRFLCDDIRPQLTHWNIDTSLIAPGFVDSQIHKDKSQSEREKLFMIMSSPAAAKVIKHGLERNDSVIGFPSLVFNFCWLLGGLHPFLFAIIQKVQKITQYTATENMVNREQFEIEHGDDDAWH